jgi:hypothetical protein
MIMFVWCMTLINHRIMGGLSKKMGEFLNGFLRVSGWIGSESLKTVMGTEAVDFSFPFQRAYCPFR